MQTRSGLILKPIYRNQTEKLQVCVRTLTGYTIYLDLVSTDSIEIVKKKIQDQVGIRPDQQRLIFAGSEFQDCKKIALKSKITLALVMRYRGEMESTKAKSLQHKYARLQGIIF